MHEFHVKQVSRTVAQHLRTSTTIQRHTMKTPSVICGKRKYREGSRLYQYLATFTSTINIITCGMHYGWPSPSVPALLSEASTIQITTDEGSWLAVFPMIAAVMGAVIASTLLDKIGRKPTILLITVPYFISWVLIATADGIGSLYAARFIAGLSDGVTFTAIPMYIGEIAEPEIRGMLCSSMSVTLIIGVLLINVIGIYFSVFHTAIIVSLLTILAFVTFVWMPESPYYLVMRGETEKARHSLKKLRGIQNVDNDVDVIIEAVRIQREAPTTRLDLFRVTSNRKALLIMMGLRLVQQFSGISAFTLYTKMIFEQADGAISAELSTTLFVGIQVIFSLFSSVIVDTTGRRPLLLISTTGATFALVSEGLYFYFKDELNFQVDELSWLPVTALLGYIVIYSLGLGTIPVLILGEIFPTTVKASALCFMDIFFSVVAATVTKFFQIMMDTYGMFVPFWVFTVCCMLGLIFIYICVPETKGKTLEEIQLELRGESATTVKYNSNYIVACA